MPYSGLQSLLRYTVLSPPCIAETERHDSASGCIKLDLGSCIEIDQIGRIESDMISLSVYLEELQSLLES